MWVSIRLSVRSSRRTGPFGGKPRSDRGLQCPDGADRPCWGWESRAPLRPPACVATTCEDAHQDWWTGARFWTLILRIAVALWAAAAAAAAADSRTGCSGTDGAYGRTLVELDLLRQMRTQRDPHE